MSDKWPLVGRALGSQSLALSTLMNTDPASPVPGTDAAVVQFHSEFCFGYVINNFHHIPSS